MYGLSTAVVVILIVLLVTLVKSKYFSDLAIKFFNKWIDNHNHNHNRTENKNDNNNVGDSNDSNLESNVTNTAPIVIEVKESDVINHEIFNHIDFWLYSHVPTIEFSSKYRTVVFRKYLHIYLKSYKDTLHIFVNSGEFKTMDDSELRKALMRFITDTVYRYETEMSIAGIPPVIINKMKVKNNDTLSLTRDLVNSICDSRFYNSEHNLLKVFSLLNIILSILENTISNTVEVCDSINGELKGFSMDGFTEGVD